MGGRRVEQSGLATLRSPYLPAVAYCVAVAVLDAALSPAVLVGALILAPLVVALLGVPGAAVVVALMAASTCALSFTWNDSWGTWTYWVPLGVNVIGASAAVVVSTLRRRDLRHAGWSGALAVFERSLHGARGRAEAHDAVLDALVPAVADVAVLDLVGDGDAVTRAAVRHPDERIGAALRDAVPDDRPGRRAGLCSVGGAGALSGLDGIHLTAVLPLKARGTALGALTLGALSDRAPLVGPRPDDLEVLADRVAIALDERSRDEDARRAQALQTAMLTQVSAAIMVRGVDGRLLYANEAAARLLRARDVDDLMAASSSDLLERFEALDEEGRPVGLDALPGTRVLRGEDDVPAVIVRNIVRATGEQRWLLNGATPLRDPESGALVAAVNVIEDVTQAKRGEHTQRLLAGALLALAAGDDLDEGLRAVADLAVPNFADWAGIDLVDARGRVRTVAVAHRDPEKAALGLELRAEYPSSPETPGSIAAVAATGESVLVPRVTEQQLLDTATDERHLALLKAIGLNSTLVVPITAGDTVLGVISFVSSSSRRFDEQDRALAQDLGRQVGTAIRAAQLSVERAAIAHTLQAGLSPEVLPEIDGVGLSAFYAPAGLANEIGGDFYDAVDCGDGTWVLVLGDVTGKGAAAASLTGQARYTLRTALDMTGDPARALQTLNRRLVTPSGERLCSAVLVRLHPDSDDVTVWRAGHPPPLHRDAQGVRSVGLPGPLLGLDEDSEWTPTTCRLGPGAELLLYTDGATDGVVGPGRLGESALRELFGADTGRAGDRLATVASRIRDACDRLPDDIAMLHLVRRGPSGSEGGPPDRAG